MTRQQLTSIPMQTVFTILGFVFLAGVQVQSAKDTQEKAKKCEARIERVEELQLAISRLEKAVTKLEVQVQYLQNNR